MNEEMIQKAKEAKSAEELLALAKENDIELTEEEAENLFDRLHATGELADEELENAAGGGGCTGPDSYNECPKCGSHLIGWTEKQYLLYSKTFYKCYSCGHNWEQLG